MTLTDIMPTLRMSIPDPIDLPAWPSQTSTTTNDVLVENLSMLRVAGLLGTPCEWATDPTPAHGCPAVVMCRVSAVVRDGDEPIILVDCAAARIGADWSQVRLIGRISTAHKGIHRILGDGSRPENLTRLPSTTAPVDTVSASVCRDVMVGDLLIVPCSSPRPCSLPEPRSSAGSRRPVAMDAALA